MAVQVRIAAITALLALGIGAAALPAQAQNPLQTFSIKNYHDVLADPKLTEEQKLTRVGWHLLGVSGGILAQAAHYMSLGERPLFCLPDDALDTRDKYMRLIDSEIRRRPDLWRKDSPQPLARLMVSAMRNQFPCRRG